MKRENPESPSFLDLARKATRLAGKSANDPQAADAAADTASMALHLQTMENLLRRARGAAVESTDKIDTAGALLDTVTGGRKQGETRDAREQLEIVLEIVQGFHQAVTSAREEAETTQAKLLEHFNRMEEWMEHKILQDLRRDSGVITAAIREYEDVTRMAQEVAEEMNSMARAHNEE